MTLSLFFNIIYRTFGAHLPTLSASALQSPLTVPLQCDHKALSHAIIKLWWPIFFRHGRPVDCRAKRWQEEKVMESGRWMGISPDWMAPVPHWAIASLRKKKKLRWSQQCVMWFKAARPRRSRIHSVKFEVDGARDIKPNSALQGYYGRAAMAAGWFWNRAMRWMAAVRQTQWLCRSFRFTAWLVVFDWFPLCPQPCAASGSLWLQLQNLLQGIKKKNERTSPNWRTAEKNSKR